MILGKGEKIHVIHRRNLEHEPHRHFVGEVEDYQGGVARVSGHLYTVPESVDLDKISYHQEKKAIRVTDGSDWHLDLSEVAWL
jgi:hypothetical protein